MVELPLARDFPPADEAAWKALVEHALKGAPFASLRSETYDGIVVEPVYERTRDAPIVPGRAPGKRWQVMQRIDLPDPATANAQILEDLNNGASALTLIFPGAISDYGYALPPTAEAIARALEGVRLDAGIEIELEFGPPSRHAAGLVADYVGSKGLDPAEISMRFGFDPLGAMAARGFAPRPWDELAQDLMGLILGLAERAFAGPFCVADGRPVHAAGGSEGEELAFTLANAVAYLRAVETAGIALSDARRYIFFRLTADQNQFLTIAKFRALRKLWSHVEEACGLDPKPAFVAAETAWRMMTKRDRHGNIVRGTIAALGAALGGADAVAVLPFSAVLGVPNAFARRIARNTHTILIEEANLHRVADPAAGSGAVEALTDELCTVAWKLFQEIERAGGAADALEAGLIQREIGRVRAMHEANAADRSEPLVGTSDFPHLTEEPVDILAAPESPQRPGAADQTFEPLRRMRIAEPFERLRDRSDAYLAKYGERPKIFLACLGRPADFNRRASFAKSLFEAGGIAAAISEVAQTPEEMIRAFKASGAKLACLCSSDRVYASEAADATKALAEAGASRIYLAGKPGADCATLDQAGVSTFLHRDCDMLAVLDKAYEVFA
jgi:methylmalonyl-CoA mutase